VAEGRFIVQVGAFSEVSKAREARLKVEKAGLKTYTHVAAGKDGKLIRVRLGPFGTKAEAEKAAEKVRALDMKAAILAL
jgi:DedD protein